MHMGKKIYAMLFIVIATMLGIYIYKYSSEAAQIDNIVKENEKRDKTAVDGFLKELDDIFEKYKKNVHHAVEIKPTWRALWESLKGNKEKASQLFSDHFNKEIFGKENSSLSSIYEPIGWSYCMSSEKSEKILKDLIAELHELFGNPPYFHIGCDEAYDMATCYKCRSQNPVSLFVGHLDKFRKFLLARGARTIIWHDMLLDREDPRWAGKIATGNQKTAEALGAFDKSIVIADWQYGDGKKVGDSIHRNISKWRDSTCSSAHGIPMPEF